MKVWIVQESYPYEGSDVVAVFSTEEMARNFVAKQGKEPYRHFGASEFEVDQLPSEDGK